MRTNLQTIRYFKGTKTFKKAESLYSPEERLVQLQAQHRNGKQNLAWTIDKDLKWEIVGEKKAEKKIKAKKNGK